MNGQQKDNSGALFKNDRKEVETHPDYKGSILIGGTDYWLSAWVNEGRPGGKMEGKKYFSIKINRKEGYGTSSTAAASPPASRGRFDDMDDDIPF